MKTIYKYELNVLDYKIIKGKIERFLYVDYQKSSERVCVWALIDDELPEEEFVVSCYGTGHKLPYDVGKYIGMIQLYSGEVVLHFFYKKAKDNKEELEI